MSKSTYLANKTLDHNLGGGDYTRPATVYVALYTSAPNAGGGGTEVSGTNYSRLAVTNNSTNFPAASSGAKSNGVDFDFATPGSGGWGTVVAMGIFDALTSGNLMYYATLTASKTINAGDPVSFPAGDLDFTEA